MQTVSCQIKKTILSWFNEDHVKNLFYGDELKNTLRNLELFCQGINNNGSYKCHHWIACYDTILFAFVMTSPIEGPYDAQDDYNQYYINGLKTFTLDLLIGEKAFFGKGLAHLMIQQLILDHYADADYFMIDPETTNSKAIHVYEKAGFHKVNTFCPVFNPKPHSMMRLEVNQLKRSP